MDAQTALVTEIAELSARERRLISSYRGEEPSMRPEPDKLAASIDTARALEAAGVPYALIGGLAVGIHAGVPRATVDVDLAAHHGVGRQVAVEALERAGLEKTGEFWCRAPGEKSHFREPLVSRRGYLLMRLVVLDRASPIPLYRQLARQLAASIRSDTMDGARLPSTRALASLLGVARNTVQAAYDELVVGGLIETRPRSGTGVLRGGRVGSSAFPPRVLFDVQYLAHTLGILDPDGASIYLTY